MDRVCEKFLIFDGNRRLSRKRYEIGLLLIWNVNRKSWVPDRKVSFSMTLSDLGFKVTVYLQVEYLQNGASYGQSYYRTLIGNHA